MDSRFWLVLGIIMIVVAIICFCFSVWNVFVTKKQISVSIVDLCLVGSTEISIFSMNLETIIMGVVNSILIIWWILTLMQLSKNWEEQKQRKKKNNQDIVKTES